MENGDIFKKNMLEIPQKTLSSIKRYLLREQRSAEENLKTVKSDDPAISSGIAESSEPGTESWIAEQHQKAIALGGQLQLVAKNVKKALSKIKNGTYGHCERCGKHIETLRLLAMPTAQLCLSCSKKPLKTKNIV